MPAPTPPDDYTALPDAPDRTEGQDTFNTKAFAWNAAIPPFGAWLQTVVDYVVDAVAYIATQVTAASTSATNAATSETNAATSATASATSAASALQAATTSATSTSSITLASGDASFTLAQTGKAFVVGQFVTIADSTTPSTKWLNGAITAFNSGTGAITVDVVTFTGSGSGSSWVIAASAPTAQTIKAPSVVTGTTQSMSVYGNYIFTNTGSQSTGTLPASPSAGERVRFDNATGRTDLLIARNGKKIMGLSEDLTVRHKTSFTMVYVDETYGWRFE